MNMAEYQLDMDMLRSMTTNHVQANGSFGDKDGNLQDMHFMDEGYSLNFKPHHSQSSTPLCPATQQTNDYMDQDDILTPLISPAITPSFSYHHKLHSGTVGTDMDFSPLTSPAMIPQQENYQYQYQSPFYQHDHHQRYTPAPPPSALHDQYDELEKTKMMITRRLSELEKRKVTQSSHQQQIAPNPTTYMTEYSGRTMAQSGAFGQQTRLEPVTPASLMNMRQQEKQATTMQIKDTPLPLNNSPYHKRRQSSTDSKAKNRKSRRPSPTDSTISYRTHISPRALKPLLASPGMKPDPSPPLDSDDAEYILATRSNYQNLKEGKAAALGIGFNQQIKSGIEVRRTAHKAAEQKRRDSLKEWFDRLRHEVEEGYVKKRSELKSTVIQQGDDDDDDDDDPSKPLSKVLLLRYAYEYIAHLKDTLGERDTLIRSLTNADESSTLHD